jgi:phosphatidylserine decarboxylase
MSDRLVVFPQYVLPKRPITALAGFIASRRWGRLTTALIRWFVAKYGVDMSEAENPDIASYATFNDFFTRSLKPGVRPLANAPWICPVDGSISQFGATDRDQILQAKGHHYAVAALLGGDDQLAEQFEHGSFATLYLSPKDYHRIHMPCDGRLLRMTYVPGTLFSVNPVTARAVPDLFARNERVVCLFETPRGPLVLTMVGATIVGGMATVWHGTINSPRPGEMRVWHYQDQQVHLKQGEEMARFMLGSTVVLLFPKSTLEFNPSWAPGRAVRLGEAMATEPLA